MHLFFQELINGLVVGSLYALVALGLALVYGTMGIPNFAHGHLYMLGAYVAFFGVTVAHIGYWPALLLAVAVLAALGVLLERVVFRPLRSAPEVNAIIAAVGVLFFLQTLAQIWFGADFRVLPTPYDHVVHLGGFVATQQQLVVIAAAAVLMVLLFLFLKRTLVGATIEAVAQNRAGAALVGIDTDRVSMLVFGISAGLAAAAATLIASISLISPTMGFSVILKAFAVIVLGGMGSIPGAIVGAFILAFAESFGGTYVSTSYQDVIAFAVLAIILAVKPTGLFAKGT
ncbi:MAG: branched-chain amino acid transport system permease protein [Candidatus Eremiobacteraeota bacterium]|nr:branched-chain amino acid transport system permease protein [Candidatus Eremiobacteraeota bacterium]